MYRWVVRRLVRVVLVRITRGHVGLAKLAFARDAEFVFPGSHSYAAHYHSRREIEAWLRDFAALRPDYRVNDIVVAGPPWNTSIAIRFSDAIAPDYANQGVHWMRMRWGRVVFEQVFLDTQRIEAWETRHPSIRRVTGSRG